MGEDPALYLAGRVRAEATDLAAVCRQRGAEVRIVPSLPRPGIYIPDPPAILLRRPDRRVTAHELLHHLARDNAANGIDYPPPEWEAVTVEEAARQFALLLTGEEV